MLKLARLLSGSAEAAARRAARRLARRALVLGLAVVFLLVGAGFLLSALWIALAREYSPLTASLAIGVAGLVLGLLALVIGNRLGRRHTRARKIEAAERKVRSELADLAEAARKVSPTVPLVGALVIGFLLARRR